MTITYSSYTKILFLMVALLFAITVSLLIYRYQLGNKRQERNGPMNSNGSEDSGQTARHSNSEKSAL